jgi:hypothetical protein
MRSPKMPPQIPGVGGGAAAVAAAAQAGAAGEGVAAAVLAAGAAGGTAAAGGGGGAAGGGAGGASLGKQKLSRGGPMAASQGEHSICLHSLLLLLPLPLPLPLLPPLLLLLLLLLPLPLLPPLPPLLPLPLLLPLLPLLRCVSRDDFAAAFRLQADFGAFERALKCAGVTADLTADFLSETGVFFYLNKGGRMRRGHT